MNVPTEQVKKHLHKLVKKADENPDMDFLDLLGEYRKRVVYSQKQLTSKEFDDVCKMVLAELPDE